MKEIIYDKNRMSRCGFPEFIYGEGKTLEQLVSVICEIRKDNLPVVVTRLREDFGKKLLKRFQEGNYDERSKCFFIKGKMKKKRNEVIGVVTAGTCDLPVAYEAINTLEACGYEYDLISDVGVAGIHRLFDRIDKLRKFSILIVIAGMEGALPSVIGGLVACPIIAVPTSVGYGSSMNGLVAMFAMLNSCASGITVVNINNGFGAACAAMRIINSK